MKNNKLPSIIWLKVTSFMLPWMEYEYGGTVRAKERLVLSVQYIKGAREIFRMETVKDSMDDTSERKSMSAMMRNCLEAGIDIDESVVKRMYGIDREALRWYVPLECPKMCVAKNGCIRPWTFDVNLSASQANRLQVLLRQAFWEAVSEFNAQYSKEHEGERYAQEDMVEAFCQKTETPEIYVDAIRREWQRRVKRENPSPRT